MQKKKGDWSASTFAEIKIPSLTWNLNYTSQHVTSVNSSISWMWDSLKTWIREHPCWLMSQIGWRPKIHRHAGSTISSQHIWEAGSLMRAPIWHHRNPCCVVWRRWQFRSLELIPDSSSSLCCNLFVCLYLIETHSRCTRIIISN